MCWMIYELMLARRSVRRFQTGCADRALIERLLEAAVTRPRRATRQLRWRCRSGGQRPRIRCFAAEVRRCRWDLIAGHVSAERGRLSDA